MKHNRSSYCTSVSCIQSPYLNCQKSDQISIRNCVYILEKQIKTTHIIIKLIHRYFASLKILNVQLSYQR